MTGKAVLSDMFAGIARWTKLVPGLLRRDPLFRYAAIAALLALFFLAARVAQDFAGPGAISPAGSGHVEQGASGINEQSADRETPPRPGSATTQSAPRDATPPAITPGRSLDNIEVEPVPRDRFGTLPSGGNAE